MKTPPAVLHRAASIFRPNSRPALRVLQLVFLVEGALVLLFWILSPFSILPSPMEIVGALGPLWRQGLGKALEASIVLNLEALFWSTLISVGVAYLSVLPAFKPLGVTLSKMRFLSMMGVTFVFMLITGGGHALKLWMLTFGITVFYVTGTLEVVSSIPRERFDYARTLRMSEWRVMWEVVVLGTFHQMLEVLRQNAAIGWMMLTMVEGIVRSEGGIGAMLLNQSKYFHLAEVFAIQFVILGIGLLQDETLDFLGRLFFPYDRMAREAG